MPLKLRITPTFLQPSKILFCLIAFALFSQNTAFAQIKKGQKLYSEGRYSEAVKPLKKQFNNDESLEAGILLSKCYYKLREYQEALDILTTVGPENLETPDDKRFYSDVLIANDDFSSAYVALIELLSEDQSDPKSYLWLDKVEDLLEWDTINTNSNVTGVRGINTIYNEYCPYVAANGEIWFVSDVTNIQTIFPNSYNNQNMHLFFTTTFRNEEGTEAKRPSWLVKRKDYYYHDGPLDDWPGQNKYALSLRDIDAPINGGLVGIYFSTLSGEEDDVIPFRYNEKYNTGHPTFTNGGTRMIFASDRPGGYGEMDLWYCDWVDNSWTPPMNMGPVINTPFNEVFPNYHDGRLFYSSDRRDMGYGGLDLYYSGELDGYNEIYNLRSPINSAYDDFGVTFGTNRLGYFSSNRSKGAGGDDIYSFVFVPEQVSVPTTRLRIMNSKIADGTPFEIMNGAGELIATGKVNQSGSIEVDELITRELYTLKIGGETLESTAVLATISPDGEVIAMFPQNAQNQFRFELLPTQDYLLDQLDDEDDSKLQFTIDGRIIAEDDVKVDDVPVSLVTKTGAVLATVKTSEGGKFRMEGVESAEEYTFETQGIDAYHEIDVFGESGAIVQSLKPLGTNSFAYTREAPKALWMTAAAIEVPSVFGIILNNETVPGEEIVLFDESDSEIRKPEIDEDGFINFGSLIAANAYRLYLSERELKLSDRLVILDASGDTSQTVRPFDKDNYFFEYLLYKDYGAPEITSTAFVEPIAVTSNLSTYRARIEPYDLGQAVPFILSKEGEKIDTIYASDKGVLVLKEIDATKNYGLELMEGAFNSETSIHIFNKDNKKIWSAISVDFRSFNLDFLEDKDYALEKLDNDDESKMGLNISGRVVAKDASNTTVTVYDSNNKLVGTTVTGAMGFFALMDLKTTEDLRFELESDDPEAELVLYDPSDGRSMSLTKTATGAYLANFNKIESEFIAEDSYSAEVQNYTPELPKAFELLDENNQVIDTVYSNVNGKIELKGLERGKAYSVRLLEGVFDTDKFIRIYDREGNIVYEGKSKNFRTFASVLLEEKDFVLEKEENEDTSLLSLNLSGRIENKNDESVEVNVFDKKMEFLAQTYTDSNGKFSVQGLPADTSYVFKIVSDSGTDGMYVLNPITGDSAYVEPGENGTYFLNLGEGQDMITVMDNDREVSVKEGASFQLPEIYYKFNSYVLEESAKASINRLLSLLKKNEKIEVEISSHTDSRGPANYNKLLSQKRAQAVVDYMVSKGIDKERLLAIGKGETELTNDCKDGVRCSNADHALNRRTEFKVVTNDSQ